MLALLLMVVPVAAGCGGGGDEGGSTNGKAGTTKKPADKTKPKPAPGSAIKDFAVNVSGGKATITANVTKPADLSLRVKKVDGSKKTKVGRVELGRKPAGRVSLPWDLKVKGKRVAAGRYELTLRGKGVGQSKPTTVTIPGG